MEKVKIFRIGGDGEKHFVDVVWLEEYPPCDMVGIHAHTIRKESREFEGTLEECNKYIKENRNV